MQELNGQAAVANSTGPARELASARLTAAEQQDGYRRLPDVIAGLTAPGLRGGRASIDVGKAEDVRCVMQQVVSKLGGIGVPIDTVLRIAVVTVAACLALVAMPVDADEVAGVRLDPTAQVGGTRLVLNGAGLRTQFGIEVYVIGLYLPQPTSSAAHAIDRYGPRRISLTFRREVSARQLVDALYEGVRDGTSEADFMRIKRDADALAEIMLPLRTAKRGETVSLDYLPHKGAQVIAHGRVVGQAVPSHDLYRALLRIWLGDNPVDPGLKQALLPSRP